MLSMTVRVPLANPTAPASVIQAEFGHGNALEIARGGAIDEKPRATNSSRPQAKRSIMLASSITGFAFGNVTTLVIPRRGSAKKGWKVFQMLGARIRCLNPHIDQSRGKARAATVNCRCSGLRQVMPHGARAGGADDAILDRNKADAVERPCRSSRRAL